MMALKAITFSLHPSPVEGLFDHNLRGSFKQAKDVGEYETKAGEVKDVAESGPSAGGAKSQAMAKTIMSAFMSVLEFGAKKAEAKFEAKSPAASENRPMPETMTEANSAAKSQSISRMMPAVQSRAMSETVSKTTMPAPKSQAMSEGQAEGNSGCNGDEGKALCSGGGGKVQAKRGGKKGGDKAAMNKIAGIDTTPALDSNRVSVAVNLMSEEPGVHVSPYWNIPSKEDSEKDNIGDLFKSDLVRAIVAFLLSSSSPVYVASADVVTRRSKKNNAKRPVITVLVAVLVRIFLLVVCVRYVTMNVGTIQV